MSRTSPAILLKSRKYGPIRNALRHKADYQHFQTFSRGDKLKFLKKLGIGLQHALFALFRTSSEDVVPGARVPSRGGGVPRSAITTQKDEQVAAQTQLDLQAFRHPGGAITAAPSAITLPAKAD